MGFWWEHFLAPQPLLSSDLAKSGKPYPVQQYTFSPHPVPEKMGSLTGIASQPSNTPVKPEEKPMSNIHDAVACLRTDMIEGMLQKNPDLVHVKGFNEQSTLHRAALRGEPEIVELLLRYGADPNACNAFEERPIHFACKRGNPRILHLLAHNGADVTATDKAGRGVMHHAAQGGSVLTMHYLVEECGLSTKVVDHNLTTLLHLACIHGHGEVFSYMMKKDRCDMYAQDIYGNNCMHIGANAGHAVLCWELLENGGISMLHDCNKDGFTPLDLAKKGHHFRQKTVAKLLEFYTKRPKKTGKAQGPLFGWYIHLLLPGVLYACSVFAAYQVPSWSGWIALAGIVGILGMIFQHTHRMQHVSRWQNPVHMGLFAAGFYHTTICYMWNILPSVYVERPNFAVMSVILAAVMNYMYYTLLTRNSGAATRSAEKDNGAYYTVRDIALGSVRLEAFCPECEIIPPRRTHHCKLCEKCYLDCDHHCLFLYRCIAKNNHRLFVTFIFICMTSMLLYEYIAVTYLQTLYPTDSFDFEFMTQVFYKEPWIWTTIATNAAAWVWGLILLRFQMMVISKGHTTAYQPNRGLTNLTLTERYRNLVHFFLGRKPFALDLPMTVY